jgi:hypothetical protein
MSIYCTYLTIYSGNKLPPFYIGYTTISNIKYRNYRGSVTSKMYKDIWKAELKDNPNLFRTIILQEHNNKKEAQDRELFLQRFFNVVHNPLYINRAITGHSDNTGMITINDGKKSWKIYKGDSLPKNCHYGLTEKQRLKRIGLGKGVKKKYTEDGMRRKKLFFSGDSCPAKRKDVREKISNTVKNLWKNGAYNDRKDYDKTGHNNPFYNKKHRPETNEINRQKHIGRVAVIDKDGNKFSVSREELLSRDDLVGVNKGKSFYTNGTTNILLLKSDVIPEGFIKGRTLKCRKSEK